MSTPTAFEREDIRTFLPTIGQEEYARRAKLRSLRNAAAAMISATESNMARQLAWFASDYATEVLYAPAALDDLTKFCTRPMLTAMQAEKLDTLGAGK
ncbi:hypothetical protein [Tsuneonella sp. SYSU-LHT278]|uniref:hypothetical protein n=1 Tax=Tsuneonella sediminis TaxID=3416089 RepID=UPI003F7AC4CF